MNIVSIMVRGTLEFIIVSVIAIPLSGDPLALAWYSLSVFLAFILRLAMEYNDNGLTWRNGIKQAIYTISYCYFAITVWFTYLNYTKGFEVYLFLNSLFAVFMVSQLKHFFQLGVTATLKKWIKTIIASEEKEVNNDGI